MTGSYDVHAAAFPRTGIVTVDTMFDLFDLAQVLCRYRPCSGSRVAMVTNGGGAGVRAVDALASSDLLLAALVAETAAKLDQMLPPGWSRGTPIDVAGDAQADRF